MVKTTRKNWVKEFLQKIVKVFQTIIRLNSLKFVKRWCMMDDLHVTQCHMTEDGTTKIMAHVLILPVWTSVVSHNEATHVVFLVFPVSQMLDLTAPCCFPFVHAHFLLSIVCENNPSEYIKLICILTYKNKRYGYN